MVMIKAKGTKKLIGNSEAQSFVCSAKVVDAAKYWGSWGSEFSE